MKIFISSIYYQFVIFTRVKKDVFFSFIFPLFIYFVFSMLWGNANPRFSEFLMSGIITMTILSSALFSIGGVIGEYYKNGTAKFFKLLKFSFISHILAVIVSRLIFCLLSSAIIILSAHFFFLVSIDINKLFFLFLGIVLGTILFSFLGLALSFVSPKQDSTSLLNLVNFGMLFLSSTFYHIPKTSPKLAEISSFLPITPVLSLTRGDFKAVFVILLWILLFALISKILFNKIQLMR